MVQRAFHGIRDYRINQIKSLFKWMKENFYISNLTFWKLIFYTIKYYWLWTVRFGHFRAQEEPPQPKQRPFLADILGWHRSFLLSHRPLWPTSAVLIRMTYFFHQSVSEWFIFGIHFSGTQFTKKKIVSNGHTVKIVVYTGEQRLVRTWTGMNRHLSQPIITHFQYKCIDKRAQRTFMS